jgi:hypothetical protein
MKTPGSPGTSATPPSALTTAAAASIRSTKHSTRRIDVAVCAIMAHSVAATADPGVQLYWGYAA